MSAAEPRLPELPPLVPRRGSALSRAVGTLVFVAMGWRVRGNMPNCAKCVLIAAPHTSTADIVVAMAAKAALGMDIRWLGKHTVHKGPLGWLLRGFGAIPVDRTAPHGVVGELVRRFREEPRLYLGLAPEGTRRRVTTWKTGFHRVAYLAEVPIVTLAFDYATHTIHVGPPLHASADFDTDLAVLRARFDSAMAYRPERYAPPDAVGAARVPDPRARDSGTSPESRTGPAGRE